MTRDPSDSAAHLVSRDPTQSLAHDSSTDSSRAHPSLALGTHAADNARNVRSEPPPQRERSSDDHSARVGDVLGSYRIVELLGKGGMGCVFRAEHVKLGREVALKQLRPDYARRRDAVQRFLLEARTVNRIRHRNIVDATDLIELDDGTTFIIMEFLRGQSLGKWAGTGIDLARALAVLVQICDGLGAAHQVGVVHRDLKPDNIIIVPTSDGAELVKLLDFGVAKLLNPGAVAPPASDRVLPQFSREDESFEFQTAAGSVIGTPAYMSPEQAGGMAIDARSDIYSLGAIMYELFCGQPMFRGRSFGEYVRKHLTESPLAPRATPGGAQLDPRIERLILKCLEKDPIRRFEHILEVRDALLGLLGIMENPVPFTTISSSPNESHAASSTPPVSDPQYYGAGTPVASQSSPWWLWVGGGAIAVCLGIGAAIWYAGRGSETPQPTSSARTIPMVTAEPALAPTASGILEVRFDSLPSGGVYVAGQSAELCRTPCTFDIDRDDGGATDRRTFVVRSENYKDLEVVVDLASAKREFKVTLEQRAALELPVAPRSNRIKKPTNRPLPVPPHRIEPKPNSDAGPEPAKKPAAIEPTDLADPFNKLPGGSGRR